MIKINGLNLTFSNNTIFKNQNFSINQGDKYLLHKESGAGKTTLFKLIQGLALPNSGEFYINNIELNSKNIHDIRSNIFYLDQDVSLPELPLPELVNIINNYKLNRNRNRLIETEAFKKYCKMFRLTKDIMDKNIGELSGGEKQRVGLIIGFLQNKPIWLLDEPTSALDKELKTMVAEMVQNLNNITVLVISHDEIWKGLKKLSWEV